MGTMRSALEAHFKRFRDEASSFSREISSELHLTSDVTKSANFNLTVTKAVFGKWAIEILVTLFSLKGAGFEELHKALGSISPRVLSEKLRLLEDRGLVMRKILNTRPPRTRYTLTEKGLTVARLGEPVILYLRFEEGLL